MEERQIQQSNGDLCNGNQVNMKVPFHPVIEPEANDESCKTVTETPSKTWSCEQHRLRFKTLEAYIKHMQQNHPGIMSKTYTVKELGKLLILLNPCPLLDQYFP